MMDVNFKIVFRKSSSLSYARAQAYAQKFPSFRLADENSDENIVQITSSDGFRNRLKDIKGLWDIIKPWKSAKFILDDKILDDPELYAMFDRLECASNYYKAFIPEKHCKAHGEWEGWGCKYLSCIEWQVGADYFNPRLNYWYQFGHFSGDELWVIDKEKISEAVLREVKQKWIHLCPVFDFAKTEKIIGLFPGQISLKEDSEWKIVYGEFASSTKVDKKPIAIRHEKIYVLTPSPGGGAMAKITVSMPKFDIEKEATDIKTARNIPDTKFSDIGGIEEIIETVREVIELPLIKPEMFRSMGIKPHKGILLYGPPGCGKTMIAKAIANEVKAHFILISGPELMSKWYGETEGNLRKVFQEARELQPSIIYWDEIDSLTQTRSGAETARGEARIVNQLLTLMDGVEQYGNICVIASTNRRELIDEALLRPGRFDYCIEIKKPSKEACYKIFSIAIQAMPVDNNFGIKEFSAKLNGLSGAEIAFVAREAAYNCLRRSRDLKKIINEAAIGQDDFKDLIITEEDFGLALKKMLEYGKEEK
jgi:transitional endoplasmic reticulum ATPase